MGCGGSKAAAVNDTSSVDSALTPSSAAAASPVSAIDDHFRDSVALKSDEPAAVSALASTSLSSLSTEPNQTLQLPTSSTVSLPPGTAALISGRVSETCPRPRDPSPDGGDGRVVTVGDSITAKDHIDPVVKSHDSVSNKVQIHRKSEGSDNTTALPSPMPLIEVPIFSGGSPAVIADCRGTPEPLEDVINAKLEESQPEYVPMRNEYQEQGRSVAIGEPESAQTALSPKSEPTLQEPTTPRPSLYSNFVLKRSNPPPEPHVCDDSETYHMDDSESLDGLRPKSVGTDVSDYMMESGGEFMAGEKPNSKEADSTCSDSSAPDDGTQPGYNDDDDGNSARRSPLFDLTDGGIHDDILF